MRNLKKILALVLSLMMVLSVMVTASATDFADDADITNKEAVEVMSALGILSGSQGKFAPKGTLERAQAAKIVAFLKLGADADALLKGTGTKQFSDVTSGWAFDYISYCAGEGIVSGSQGKFFPKNTLTGYEFGKMVLNAAGVEGTYTGSQWKINVATALKKANLLTGLETLVLSANITREQASQLAFNAMNYSSKGTVKEYVVKNGATVIYQGTDAMTALLMKAADSKYTLELGETVVGSLADTVYNVKKTTTTDDFGRTSTTYVDKTDAKKVIASFPATPVLSLKGATTEGKLAAALGCTKVSDKVKVTVITDGTPAPAKDMDKTGTGDIGAVGATVEVYKTGADTYNVVVIKTHVKKLEAGDIKKAVKATATSDAIPAFIVIEGTAASAKYDDAGSYVTDKFKAGDVVLYTKGSTGVQSVELAKAVVGTVGKYTTATTTVGGVTYTNAQGFTLPSVSAPATVFNTAYTYYVDADNNVYTTGAATEAPVTADGFFYVLAYQVAYDGVAGDLFNDADTAVAVKAQVVTTEGEVKVVDLDTYTDEAGDFYFVNPKTCKEEKITGASGLVKDVNTWVAYTAEKNVYTVCALSTGNAKADTLASAYEKGSVKLNVTDPDPYMTSATTYTYINTKDNTTKTTTGYKSIAIADGTKVLVVYADAKQTTVAKIYSVKTATDTSTSSANYAYVAEVGATVANGTEVTFYIGGEVKTMVVKTGVAVPSKGHVYNLTIDSKGVVTAIADKGAVDVNTAKEVTAVEDTYVVADTVTVFAKAGVEVYNLTKDGAKDTIKVGDYIVVVEAGNDTNATLIYIVG